MRFPVENTMLDPKITVTLVCLAIAAGAWLMARFTIKVYQEAQRENRP